MAENILLHWVIDILQEAVLSINEFKVSLQSAGGEQGSKRGTY